MTKKSPLNIPALLLIFVLVFVIWSDRSPQELSCEVKWEGIEKMCQPSEDYAYANGLAMAQRILSEQNMLAAIELEYGSDGVPHETEVESCEQVVSDLYDQGYKIINP